MWHFAAGGTARIVFGGARSTIWGMADRPTAPAWKHCRKCRKTKRISEYDGRRDRPTQALTYCRACTRPSRMPSGAAATKSTPSSNARRALAQSGAVAPRTCQACGIAGDLKPHHASYAPQHWLDVAWLCPHCLPQVNRWARFREENPTAPADRFWATESLPATKRRTST